MNLIARIAELANWLEWALDIIDLYDQRLAAFDGPEMVYTETHVRAKEKVREILKDYKRFASLGDKRLASLGDPDGGDDWPAAGRMIGGDR